MNKYPVSLKRCDCYDPLLIEKKINEGLKELGGIGRYIKENDKVLLKPNLLTIKKPEAAVLTHPEFIRAIIRIVKKAGARCALGDSPGLISAQKVAAFSGIKKICDQENIPVIDLKTPLKIKTPQGKIAKFLILAKEIFKYDKIINLPKLKNHNLTSITVAAKNLFGTVPGIRKAKYHFSYQTPDDFSAFIVELNRVVKPCLNIVDAIIGMEGDGPMGGKPKKIGLIIMGTDTTAVDYISAAVMNYNPDEVPTIKMAKNYQLGGFDKKLIEIRGEKLEECIVKDFKTLKTRRTPGPFPSIIRKIASRLLIKKPFINKSICSGCKNCEKICPVKGIKIADKKAAINYKKCIKCYCCSEICPHIAVKIRFNPFV